MEHTTDSRPIHQAELTIGKKDQLCEVDFRFSEHRKLLLKHMHRLNSILPFSDGASSHFKNNTNVFNLIH